MRIGVRGTNWIGDAVMSVPALHALRNNLPDAQIHLLTDAWARDVFEDSGLVDKIIELDSNDGLRSQVRTWQIGDYDAAILFTNSFRSALAAKLGGTKRRFGFKNEYRAFLLSDSYEMPKWKNERHEIYFYLDLIDRVLPNLKDPDDILDLKPDTKLKVSNKHRERALQIFAKNNLQPPRPIIVIGAGSQNSRAKRWLPEYFSHLANRISSEIGAGVILLGSAGEREYSEMIRNAAGNEEIVNLAGKTTLSEAISILAEADLMVSNDMGLAHISTAVGTKTFTIFGPTNPLTTAPFGCEIINATDIECAPCMLRDCPIDHRCMTRISPDYVFERILKYLI